MDAIRALDEEERRTVAALQTLKRKRDNLIATTFGALGFFGALPTELVFAILDRALWLDEHAPFAWFDTGAPAGALRDDWCRCLYAQCGGLERDMPNVTEWVSNRRAQFRAWRACPSLQVCCELAVAYRGPPDPYNLKSLVEWHIDCGRASTAAHFMRHWACPLRLRWDAVQKGVLDLATFETLLTPQDDTSLLHSLAYKHAKDKAAVIGDVVAFCGRTGLLEPMIRTHWNVGGTVGKLPSSMLHAMLKAADLNKIDCLDAKELMALNDPELVHRPWKGHANLMAARPDSVLCADNVQALFPTVGAWPCGNTVPSLKAVERLRSLYGVKVPAHLVPATRIELVWHADEGPVAWPTWEQLSTKLRGDEAFYMEMARRGAALPMAMFVRDPRAWKVPHLQVVPAADVPYRTIFSAAKRAEALPVVLAVARHMGDHTMARSIARLIE